MGHVQGGLSMSKIGLKTVYMVSMTVVFAATFLVFVVLDIRSQNEQSEQALLEEARVFSDEMDAVWTFMDNQQKIINYTESGEFEFKGLHCSIVGLSVGRLFSANNEYEIRYTNFNPRNIQDTPDEFEAEALTLLTQAGDEFYAISEYQGEEKFRYLKGLEVKKSCLDCHGVPEYEGEIDITGYEKEGWTLDSVGGAISVVIPIEMQRESVANSVARDAIYFLALTLLIGATIYFITSKFVFKPLNAITESFGKLQGGDMSTTAESSGAAREMSELIDRFNEMAKQLEYSYANLEGEVAKRTHELSDANKTLEELNEKLKKEMEFKSDFLSMISHELRTPLTSIITFTQISREAAQKTTSEQEIRAWAEIEKNSLLLLGMINNILDIARSDAGKINTEQEFMDLGDITNSLKSTITPLAQRVDVNFTTKIDSNVPLVKGDYEKTLRMLENLANNAIKFTASGGKVHLQISFDEDSKTVSLSMSDNGIGIAPENQERIFERFVQVDRGTTRKFNGSGLGLALVKDYAALQGFRVSVQSELGVGSTFTIKIGADHILIEGEQTGDNNV